MSEFMFDTDPMETKWLVEGLIPMGQFGVILAQAGTGKSLLVEDLGIHVIYDIPFCGFKTEAGDVLLIDQDTPNNVLATRLLKFSRGLGERKHKLFLESMNGYSLSDGSLITVINNYSTVKLVIIDSMHSVCGQFNPDRTGDMSRALARIKTKCLNEHKTILVNHHISEKIPVTIDSLMLDMTNRLAMGNSSIIQQADTYYVVGATATEGRTNKLYVRPVSKRVSIPLKPLVLRVVTTSAGGESMEYEGYYEPDLTDIEQDILTLFRVQHLERSAKEVYEGMGHKHGENVVRKALNSLEIKGFLFMSRHKSNLFKYRMP